MKIHLPVLCCLVLAATPFDLRAADTNQPSGGSDKLEAFMEKWRTSLPISGPMEIADRPMIMAALAREPQGPWFGFLMFQGAETGYQLRQAHGDERKNLALGMLSVLRQAQTIVTNALAADATNATLREYQATILQSVNILSLEAGVNLPAIRADLERQLAGATNTNDWNQGNIIYQANELLGRVAMREGKFDEARRCLRAATKSPGSPQLRSFGPGFVLARECLEHGATEDRQAVLAFLEDVKHFWGDPGKLKEANSRRVAEDNIKELDAWRQQISDGKIPDSPKWR